MSHAVIEIEEPSYRYDGEGWQVVVWDTPPPAGFDEEVDGHNCVVGEECCGWNGRWGNPVGLYLSSREDTYGAEVERVTWAEVYLVDGKWVVCGDCSNAIEDGDLSVSPDGVWAWREDDAA